MNAPVSERDTVPVVSAGSGVAAVRAGSPADAIASAAPCKVQGAEPAAGTPGHIADGVPRKDFAATTPGIPDWLDGPDDHPRPPPAADSRAALDAWLRRVRASAGRLMHWLREAALADESIEASMGALQTRLALGPRDETPARRQAVALQAVRETLEAVRAAALAQLQAQQQPVTQELADLLPLAHSTATQMSLLRTRVRTDGENADKALWQIKALRSVRARLVRRLLELWDASAVAQDLEPLLASPAAQAQPAVASMFRAPPQRAASLSARVLQRFEGGAVVVIEMRRILIGSFEGLNGERGFALDAPPLPSHHEVRSTLRLLLSEPSLQPAGHEVQMAPGPTTIDSAARQEVRQGVLDVFEQALDGVRAWMHETDAQLEQQLSDRLHALAHRRQSFERLGRAVAELEARLACTRQCERELAARRRELEMVIAATERTTSPD